MSGFFLAIDGHYPLNEFNWLTLSLALFVITGVIWAFVLIPLQKKIIQYSGDQAMYENYTRTSRIWDAIGSFAVIIPLIILYLMVMKPF